MLVFTVTPRLDLTQFAGYRVKIDRPAADGIPVGGTFTGVVNHLDHAQPHPGGSINLDPGGGRSGGRTALAVPYGSTITVYDEEA